MKKVVVVAVVLSGLAISMCPAAVTLPEIIGDNMVLQRDMAAPIWGWTEPNETVTITFDNDTYTAKPDAGGKWMVKLNPHKAGGPFEMTIRGKNTITLKNILVGEVWLCSGQSNMVWSVMISTNAKAEVAAAQYQKIRLFTVNYQVAPKPQAHLSGGHWVECSPTTVGEFSGVAYFFGRDLYKQLDIPVGLMTSAVGATFAEAWTSPETIALQEQGMAYTDRWQKDVDAYPQKLDKFIEEVKQWQIKVAAADANKQPLPQAPAIPQDPRTSQHRPSALYNGMIAPLIPFAIRGAIWYQGESNYARAYGYRKVFPAMIKDWRAQWGEGDFPFLYVQLANFYGNPAEPVNSSWAELREAQTMALALPNTAMAVTIDIGQCENIHPLNKQDVGNRLALAALANVYGKKIEWASPLYDSMKIEGNKIRIKFTNTYGKLKTGDGREPTYFAIAGKDKKFIWARTKIEKDTVVVWSDAVKEPLAVRYGWADCPTCNLYNKANLPVSPFRTDDWPGTTLN